METVLNHKSIAGNIISWIFGLIFLAIGIINTFWGNDMGFGIFIILLSMIYFFPIVTMVREITGFKISVILVKVVLGLLIIWAAMGVGELPDKVEMMLN